MAEPLRRAGIAAAVVGGTTAAASAAGSLAAAAYFARRVLTPERSRPDDVRVLAVGADTVLLEADPETVVPGRYGLWFDAGAGHARVGDVIATDPDAGTVRRVLDGVDRGILTPGRGRWDSSYYGDPPGESLGVPMRYVTVEGELGRMPAWVVPGDRSRWAVLVHGRGATKEETVRAVPALMDAGWTCMAASYRNDEGVPPGPDGRYNLGLSEWRDVEAAVRHAVREGAREVLLAGWSMGGAITMQFLDRSPLRDVVPRVVLDGPVLDWGDVLAHHARLNRIPHVIDTLATSMMGRRWGKRIVGVHESVDVARTDWVTRADEVRTPMLVIHSADDEFVPVGPSRALAQRRPDLVTFVEWQLARHVKEWNVDPDRWREVVAAYAAG